MKKSDYLQTKTNISQRINRDIWGMLIAAVLIIMLTLITPELTKKLKITTFSLSAIGNGLAIIIGICQLIFIADFIVVKSKHYKNRLLKRQKNELLKVMEKLKSFKHQHEAISERIITLLRYYHRDEETMAELKNFLNKESFSYVFYPFRFLVPFGFESETTFADVIGDDVEELLNHIKTLGWGDYAHRLRGSIKIKIHTEEDVVLSLIASEIEEEIKLIDSLED